MPEGALLADANVLIDYAKAGPRVLGLASAHLGGLHVVSVVLHAEVRQLNERTCQRLGIDVIEPTFDQLAEAGSGPRVLSFHDWCCLIVARDRRHALVTNDKALRKAAHVAGLQPPAPGHRRLPREPQDRQRPPDVPLDAPPGTTVLRR